MTILIRPFVPGDAPAMRDLVLAGLGEHWGTIDYSMNPDLDDIAGVYHDAGAAILIAERDGEVVGCGILVDEPPDAGRLVRMSVRSDQRGQGLGKRLVFALIDEARSRGHARVVCETTDTWTDAITLYSRCGFTETTRHDGDIHFSFSL
jgi:GNAT superfamily N-acetyltransferase